MAGAGYRVQRKTPANLAHGQKLSSKTSSYISRKLINWAFLNNTGDLNGSLCSIVVSDFTISKTRKPPAQSRTVFGGRKKSAVQVAAAFPVVVWFGF